MATIKGNNNDNILIGTSDADFIFGYDGDDEINGKRG